MRMLPSHIAFVFFLSLWFNSYSYSQPPKPASHTTRCIEGWIVHIDDRLLTGDDKQLGEHALRILANRLYDIAMVVPESKLAKLRRVPIWLDRTHGKLAPAQYHPSAAWLEDNGYAKELAKCVHIPDASDFSSLEHQRVQPWSVLHELAHAYHDRELGFDDKAIAGLWARVKESGRFDKVLHINGRVIQHYALTTPMEFFAEMSEAYFGVNDFFPFNRAELRRDEPEVYALMERVWRDRPWWRP